MSIKQNIRKIRQEIPKNITILAATKTRTVQEIQEAIEAGITDIGENYVQEAETKYNELKGKATLHLIGHLQSNKAKTAVNMFDVIESVDSIKLAKAINKEAEKLNKIQRIFIEINIAKEPNKTGCMPEEAEALANEIQQLKNLKLEGTMTMAPYMKNNEDVRHYFKETKNDIAWWMATYNNYYSFLEKLLRYRINCHT